MATVKTKKNGVTTWELDDDELSAFNNFQRSRIESDRDKINEMISEARKQYDTVSKGLSSNSWTSTKNRVNLHKDIYRYQNNLARLKSYGIDVDDQLNYTSAAMKAADARSYVFSNFDTADEYDDFMAKLDLENEMKDFSYEGVQDKLRQEREKKKQNGRVSGIGAMNYTLGIDRTSDDKTTDRRIKALETWTKYSNSGDYEKAIKNLDDKIKSARSEYAKGYLGDKSAANSTDKQYYNQINFLKTQRTRLKGEKADLEFSNLAQEYAKRLSGDEVRMIKDYNGIYDRSIGKTASGIFTSLGSGGASTDTSNNLNDDLRRQEIKDYFENRGIDLKTVSDVYRSEANKISREALINDLKSKINDSDASKILSGFAAPFAGATGGIPSLVGNVIYGSGVKYNTFNNLNVASNTMVNETLDNISAAVKKNAALVNADGSFNWKGNIVNSIARGAYDLYYTVTESAIARVPATVSGISVLTDALFGINAFTSTYNDMLDSGADTSKALFTGALAGVFEGLFERLSLEKLKAFQGTSSVTIKDLIKNGFKQVVTEGSEELFTDFANTIADQLINGDASELNKRMQALVAGGMTYNEARAQVAKEYAQQETETFLIGGLSGLVGGVSHTGMAAINNSMIGSQINSGGQRSALINEANSMGDKNATLNAARLAAANDEAKNKKGLGANLHTGNLYNLAMEQAYNNMTENRRKAVNSGMIEALSALGVSKETAGILGNIAAKTATGETLSRNEKRLAESMNSTTSQLDELSDEGKSAFYKVFYSDGTDKLSKEDVAERLKSVGGESINESQAQSLAELMKNKNAKTSLDYYYARAMYDYGAFTDEASSGKAKEAERTIRRLVNYASGLSSESATAVKTGGEDSGKNVNIVKFTSIDSKNHTATLELSDGTSAVLNTESADNSDIRIPDSSENFLYTLAGATFKNAESANAFITGYKKTDMSATDYANEFMTAVRAGSAQRGIPETNLPAAITRMAYDIGADNSESAVKKTAQGTTIKGNRNLSRLDVENLGAGAVNYSTSSLAGKDMKIAEQVLDAYGKKHGIRYVLVDSIKSDNGRAHGLYSANENVVYLATDTKNPLTVTAGHETFHYVKNANSEAGKELQEYIISKLKADKKYGYDKRFEELSKLYGTTDADAINEEIAANSMFDLMNEETVKELAENHKGLFDLIKEKLDEVISYIRGAVEKYAKLKGSKEARALKDDRETLEKIRADMNKALDEINNAGENKKSSGESGERYLFAGDKSENADITMLEKAKEMLENGDDSETVRKQTGWFKGYDNKWRYEIDNENAHLIENPDLELRGNNTDGFYRVGKLTDIYENKNLYSAYPELKNVTVIIQETEAGTRGSAFLSDGDKQIVLSQELFKRHTKAYKNYAGERDRRIKAIEQTPEYKEYNKYFSDDEFENMPAEKWLKAEKDAERKFFETELGKEYYQLMWGKTNIQEWELGWSENAEAVLNHELQHLIQSIEKTANGSSPRWWRNAIYVAESNYKQAQSVLLKKADSMLNVLEQYGFETDEGNFNVISDEGLAEARSFLKSVDAPRRTIDMLDNLEDYITERNKTESDWLKVKDRSPGDLYKSTAGEVEARDAANRANFNTEKRSAVRPDIDRSDVVFAKKEFEERFSLEENDDIVRKYEQVEAENKELRDLNELLSAELKRSPADGRVSAKGEKVFTDIVTQLVKKYKSSVNVQNTAQRLIDIYNYAARYDGNMDEVAQAVAVVAKDIIRESSLVYEADDMSEVRKEMRQYLRETPIRLSDEAKELISEEYGSYEKFRKKYFGQIRFTSDMDAPTLDYLWGEITDQFRGIFSETDAEADSVHQPFILAEALSQNGDMYFSDLGESDLQTLAVSMATEIMKDYAVQSLTAMDRQARRTAAEKNAMRARADKELAAAKAETKKSPAGKVTEKGLAAIGTVANEVIREHFAGADSDVRNAARKLLKKELTSIYTDSGVELDFERLEKLARRIVVKSTATINENEGVSGERLRFSAWLRKNKIRLSSEQVDYVFSELGGIQELGFGLRTALSDDTSAPELSEVYNQIKSEFPSLFLNEADEETPQGQIDAIIAAYNVNPTERTIELRELSGVDVDTAAYKLAGEMADMFTAQAKTYADRQSEREEKEIRALKSKISSIYEKSRRQFEWQKYKYEKQIAEDRAKLGTMIMESREIRYDLEEKRYQRARIRTEIRDMSKKVLEPTKTKFVPAELRGAVAKFLDIFTTDNLMFKKDDLAQLSAQYRKIIEGSADGEFDELAAGMNEQIAGYIDELAETLAGKKLKFTALSLEQLKKIKDIVYNLKHAINNYNSIVVEGKKIEMYDTAAAAVAEMPQNAEKMKMFKPLSELYNKLVRYGNLTPYYFFKRMGGVFNSLYKDLYSGEMSAALKVSEAQEQLGAIYEKYKVKDWINSGEKFTFKTERGETFQMTYNQILDLYADYRTMLEDSDGEDALHLTSGGIVFLDDVRTEKRSLSDKFDRVRVTYEYSDKSPILLTADDIEKVISVLGNKRRFADEMIKYLSGPVAKMANEASVRLYGYEMFDKKVYYPIKTSAYHTGNARNAAEEDSRKPGLIKNIGVTNSRVKGAKNPVVVRNFTETCAQHVVEMITFTYMSEAQSNLFRMLNYRSGGITNTETGEVIGGEVNMRTSLDNAYGMEAARYIDTLIEDMSSGLSYDAGESAAAAMLTKFKKLATAANLSVTIQQPTAIMRAMAYVDPKYFVKKISWSKSFNEAKKYAGTAVLKDIGGYDMNNNRSAVEYLLDYGYDAKDKAKAFNPKNWNAEGNAAMRDDVFGYGAEKADAVTWGHIWEACKAETAAKTKLTGEELLKASGERFNEVIEATQVYDSVLSRSQFMRGKSLFTKMATSFMGEPTKTLNMFADANYQRWIAKEKGSWNYLTRSVAALVMSNILNALVRSIVSALRKEPEKGYLETYVSEVLDSFIDGSAITGMMPFIKDIVSIFQGEDITRDDLSPLMDIYNAIQYGTRENADAWDKANALLVPAGVISGLPLRNISRDIRAMLNIIGYAEHGRSTAAGIKYSLKDTINEQIKLRTGDKIDVLKNDDYDKLFKYYDSGKIDEATDYRAELKAYLVYSGKSEDQADRLINKKIKEHITNNSPQLAEAVYAHITGDVKTYTDKMSELNKTYDESLVGAAEKSIESDVKNAAKAKKNNNTDEYNKYRENLTSYGFDEKRIDSMIEKSEVSESSSSGGYDGIYTNKDAVRAYVSGDISLYEKIYKEMGEKKASVKSALKDLYISGEVSGQQAEKMYNDVFASGDSVEDKKNNTYFTFEAWQSEAQGEEYSRYDDIKTAADSFTSGKTSTTSEFKTAANELTAHGVKASSIKSQITTLYRPQIQELYKSDRTAYLNMRARIASLYVALGDDRTAALKKIDKWVKD